MLHLRLFLSRASFSGLFFMVLIGAAIAEQQTDVMQSVPTALDLTRDADLARSAGKPILLMFVASDCEYCERLEEDVIRPMLIQGELQRRVILRKVMIDSIDHLKDFKGGARGADAFAHDRGIQVTPTLQFVDANGQQLVPQMIGYQSVDWYGAYLENAIGNSEQKLGATSR